MKIGILTLHSQLNYGGVLQCWALVQALTGMGHEVVVIDRWYDSHNSRLLGPFSYRAPYAWGAWAARGLLGSLGFRLLVRHIRTTRFVRKLGLTKFHFVSWRELGKLDLGVDCLVVGSDQVWNATWNDPSVFLLEGAPAVRAIAYAVSLGMREVPVEWRDRYRQALGRFDAISMREHEGVEIVKRLGFVASHVVDPTLLVQSSTWKESFLVPHRMKHLVCYFLRQDMDAVWPELKLFAQQNHWTVEVFVDGRLLPVVRSWSDVKRRMRGIVGNVRIAYGAGPVEFVKAISGATAVVSDSFHAMVLSSIYGINARILRPMSEERKGMFARMEEFACSMVGGPLVSENIRMALGSIASGERVSYREDRMTEKRDESRAWLDQALRKGNVHA